MTLEEIFTKAADHLLKQGTKSWKDPYTCGYRGMNGKMCAVGCLIDDAHYKSDLEYKMMAREPVLAALRQSGVPINHETVRLMQRLQNIHDNREPAGWKEDLQALAKTYGFKYENSTANP